MRRLAVLAVLVPVVVFGALALTLVFISMSPPTRFLLTYTTIIDWEAALFLLLAVAIAPPLSQTLNERLPHVPGPPSRSVKVLAAVMIGGGLLVFAFWVAVDLLGGINGPGYTYSNYSILNAIHNWFGFLGVQKGEMGKIGFPAFLVSVAGFAMLRLQKGLLNALRDSIVYFAAPILIAFELSLWYYIPVDMYWKVTGFTPWTLGQYLSNSQFATSFGGQDFTWGGNIYILSNWSVLVIAALACAAGLVTLMSRSRGSLHQSNTH